MTLRFDADPQEYVLSSGRRFYAHRGIVGLGDTEAPGEVSEGFDGGVDTGDWSAAERAELAAFMIARWMAWQVAG